ncbi:poly(U)-specific endoribonuclease-B-like [Brachionus plicatilis]|uniref:Uridylate-specific endoribonuclease n=1 Tax=Brachionus plicatilis TaxID=10195 RepID=A0A3M7RF81_BRAPC|nr:poly(U)-specific endoribonuclease-B-like [Brachionus plicatilis]
MKIPYEEDKETDEPGILAISFSMDGVFKPLGGFLIGFSPEFEIALYTIVFLCGEKKTRLNFANLDVIFECYKMERNDKEVLATIYPTV